MKMKNTPFAFLLVAIIMGNSLFAQDTTQKIVADRRNDKSQIIKPYVILISADGFRADFTEMYEAKFLQSISQK
jgi:hypothetical protein